MTEAQIIEQEAITDARGDFEIAQDKLEELKKKVADIDIPRKDVLFGIGLFSGGLYLGSKLPRFLRKIVSTLAVSVDLLIALEMIFGDDDGTKAKDQLRPDDATNHPGDGK